MIISNYGVTLKKLRYEDIEMVRGWRNDPDVSQYMEYRNHITKDMQEIWFESINNELNYFFIIEYKNRNIGLTEVKKINKLENSGELGIFIAKEEFQNSITPFQVAISLIDFAFEDLKLSYLVSHVLKENKRARRFNEALGFVIEPNQEENNKQFYKLQKNYYEKKSSKIRKVIKQ
jgi:RimJ/RimL family protein N-acetyltransferase